MNRVWERGGNVMLNLPYNIMKFWMNFILYSLILYKNIKFIVLHGFSTNYEYMNEVVLLGT